MRHAVVLVLVAVCLSPAQLAGQSVGTDVPVVTDRVRVTTTLGSIDVELYGEDAPVTVGNFIEYVEDGLFDGGSFFRVVREDNQPNDSVRIAVVQGGPPRGRADRYRPPIPLERTRDTGVLHVDGAISMARGGPDTGRSQFFICIGDQPELDFTGRRNPDGQGFAAFGRVVEGMDIVRRIQRGDVDGQRLVDPVTIVSIARVES